MTATDYARFFAQPRHALTLRELEAWLATDQPSWPDDAVATCICNGHGCEVCAWTGLTTVAVWRRELRARIEAELS